MSLSLSLYRLDEVEPDLLREALDWLEPEQRRRAERFATELLRKRFVAAQARLRQHLAGRLGVCASAIVLQRDEFGKPGLETPRSLHFSLSHCRGWALVASSDDEVGVDLEALIDPPSEELAAQFLDARALARWTQETPEQASALLTLAWCAREAVLKLDGRGLAIDPRSVSLPIELPAWARWDESRQRAHVVPLAAPEGFRACLASHQTLELPGNFRITIDASISAGADQGRKSSGRTTM